MRDVPGTPTDQAHIESQFSHVKGERPHPEQIRDPTVLDTELEQVRIEYNTVRPHAAIGYVTPTTNAKGEQKPSGKPDGKASPRYEPPVSPTVDNDNTTGPDSVGNYPAENPSLTQKHVTSPADGLLLPNTRRIDMRLLNATQVNQLATALPGRYGSLVTVAVYTGLRWGELAGLQTSNIDMDRRRLTVKTSLIEASGQPPILGSPRPPADHPTNRY